jgi:hypothetical protein
MIRMGILAEMEERTVLDAVRAPLALRDLAEYRVNLSQQLVGDPVLGTFFEVLEGVLKKDNTSQSEDEVQEDARGKRDCVPARRAIRSHGMQAPNLSLTNPNALLLGNPAIPRTERIDRTTN